MSALHCTGYTKDRLPLLESTLALEVVAHRCEALNDSWQVEGVITGCRVHSIGGRWRWCESWEKGAQSRVLDLEVVDLPTEGVNLAVEVVDLQPQSIVLFFQAAHLVLRGSLDEGLGPHGGWRWMYILERVCLRKKEVTIVVETG